MEGFPMRAWNIAIYLVGPDGEDFPATCFEKATYLLHESFGKKAKQSTLRKELVDQQDDEAGLDTD